MKRKEGYDIKTLAGIGVTFVVIAIILSFGSTILSDLKDDQLTSNNAETKVVVNSTKTIANATTYTFETFRDCSLSGVIATNATTFRLWDAGNYTVSGCKVTWIGENGDLNTNHNINWSYTATFYPATSVNATYNGLEGLEEFSSWLPTLALIIVAAIIIGIIVAYFGFSGVR